MFAVCAVQWASRGALWTRPQMHEKVPNILLNPGSYILMEMRSTAKCKLVVGRITSNLKPDATTSQVIKCSRYLKCRPVKMLDYVRSMIERAAAPSPLTLSRRAGDQATAFI